MMTLNNSLKNSCFLAICDHSAPYENYPDKSRVKESIYFAGSSWCVNARIPKLAI